MATDHGHIYSAMERVSSDGRNLGRDTGVLLAAFKTLQDADNFAIAHADEVVSEIKTEIASEIEQHVLRATKVRVQARVEHERILFWALEKTDTGIHWKAPNPGTRLQI